MAKIKKFAKEYIAKILRKLEKSRKHKDRRHDDTPGSSSTPISKSGSLDTSPDAPLPNLTLADVLGVGADDEDYEEGQLDEEPSPQETQTSARPGSPSPSGSSSSRMVSDPRIRHRNEESGWDPSTLLSGPADRGLGISC